MIQKHLPICRRNVKLSSQSTCKAFVTLCWGFGLTDKAGATPSAPVTFLKRSDGQAPWELSLRAAWCMPDRRQCVGVRREGPPPPRLQDGRSHTRICPSAPASGLIFVFLGRARLVAAITEWTRDLGLWTPHDTWRSRPRCQSSSRPWLRTWQSQNSCSGNQESIFRQTKKQTGFKKLCRGRFELRVLT